MCGLDPPAAHPRGGQLDGLVDLQIAGAAAEVPPQRLDDLRAVRRGLLVDEGLARQEEPGSAVPALCRAKLRERLLQRVEPRGRLHALDRRDLPSLQGGGDLQTGEDRPAVDEDGARPALAQLATVLGAGEPQLLAKNFEESMVKRRGDGAPFPVHRERQLNEPWLHEDKVNAAGAPCTDHQDRGYLVRMVRRGEQGAIEDSRLDRLRRLVAHAYERVPFYRERLQLAGVRPGDIRAIDDIALLPITDKRDLADRPPGEITASGLDPARLVATMTSGYSGEPFVIRRTRREQTRWARSWLPDLLAAGLRSGDRVASVFAVREERTDGVGLLETLGLVSETVVDCAEDSPEIIRQLAKARPDFLRGMAGVLEHLANSMAEAERPIRPRVVWVSGEVLTPVARRRIEAAFAAPVHNAYGTHEIGLLASDCRDSGLMHVSSPGSIVEILTPDNRHAEEGETGEVVVTALDFFAAPFIRYRLKDLATRGAAACPCGARFPTIAHIDGRSIDYFEMPDGRYLHPYRILGPALAAAPWIRQYQLVQESRDRIVLRLVREGPLDESERRRLRSTVDSLLGPDVRFRVEAVPRIAGTPGGKSRPIVSLVE